MYSQNHKYLEPWVKQKVFLSKIDSQASLQVAINSQYEV